LGDRDLFLNGATRRGDVLLGRGESRLPGERRGEVLLGDTLRTGGGKRPGEGGPLLIGEGPIRGGPRGGGELLRRPGEKDRGLL